jgi:DegV family protein with EDD domain
MIGIVTDSTCDIPQQLLDRHGIVVVPQVLVWGEQQYRDRVDMQPGEFYQRLTTDPVRPHTSQPGGQEFLSAFEKAAKPGVSALIALVVSSALSGTIDAARKAAGVFKLPVDVIDSHATSMGLGWQVLAAARAIEEGVDLQGVQNRVLQVRRRIFQYAGLDTLEYLKKGGRIGDAARWATSLLKIKPVVALNILTNLVEPIGLVRTYNALVETLYHKFFDQFKNKNNLHVAVLHGNQKTAAEGLVERIKSEINPLELLVNSTGPVVGLHTGPGALGICGFADD